MSIEVSQDRYQRSYSAVILSFLGALSITGIFALVNRLFARRANGENVDAEIDACAEELSRRRVGTNVSVQD